MAPDELNAQLEQGGRLVVFFYAISALVVSFKRSSAVYYIPPGGGTFAKALPYILISLLVGWWGIPFGLVYTPSAIFRDLRGGEDVTRAAVAAINESRTPPHVTVSELNI